MIANDFRFQGFDEASWLRLLSLLGVEPATAATPLAVVVVDEQDQPIAAFNTEGQALDVGSYSSSSGLAGFCEANGMQRGIKLRQGAIERLTDRASTALPMPGNYAVQWLVLLELLREAEADGLLSFHPDRRRPPLPSAAVLRRAADLVLPAGRALVLAIHDRGDLWTAVALRRGQDGLDMLVGPRTILGWTGPLGGAYRRDHRVLTRSVSAHMAPVQLGIYAERERFERLLRDPSPGAWASAVATRDVLIEPAPAYVSVAMAADAARATAALVKSLLGGADPLGALGPAAVYARERVGRVASMTALLGFNPLRSLSNRLQRNQEGER